MKPSSAKAKGRQLQQYVAGKILAYFPSLTSRDVTSTSMGANGSDVKLSEVTFKEFPFAIECKNLASIAVYKYFEQAQEHAKKEGGMPMLVIKQNKSQPLVILSLQDFMEHYYG